MILSSVKSSLFIDPMEENEKNIIVSFYHIIPIKGGGDTFLFWNAIITLSIIGVGLLENFGRRTKK